LREDILFRSGGEVACVLGEELLDVAVAVVDDIDGAVCCCGQIEFTSTPAFAED